MRRLTFGLILIIATLGPTNGVSLTSAASKTQEKGALTLLKLKQVHERRLVGGERHPYEAVVEAGHYIHCKVEQRGVDVVLFLKGPDGADLLEIDTPNGIAGYESLDFVAKQTGTYQLIITALDKNAKAGNYRLRLTELRKATPNDAVKTTQQQSLITATERENRASELMGKGQPAEAEPLLQEAATLRQRVPGEPYRSRPLSLLASAYEAQGKNELALRTHKEALRYLERDTGKGSASVGYTLYAIGRFYLAQDNLAQAEANLRHGVKILDKADDVPPATLMIAHQTFASLYRKQKRFSHGVTEQHRAIELAEKVNGSSESVDSAYLHNELGEIYLEQKDIDRAIDAFQKAMAICDKIKVDREIAVKVLLNLATATNVASLIARQQNNFDRAEEKGRAALELLQRLANENRNYETEILKTRALFLNNLGEALLGRNDDQRKDSAAAEKIFREALDLCEKLLPENEVTATVLINLGSLLYKREDYVPAELLLHKAIDLHRSIKSPPEKLFKPVYLLGQLEMSQDNFGKAELHLLEARRIGQQDASVVAEIDSHLGKLYTTAEDFNKAESRLKQALEFYEKRKFYSFALAEVYLKLGKMYEAKGSFTQAEPYFLRAVRIVRKTVPDGRDFTSAHVSLLNPLNNLAFFYINRGKYEQAEQVISEVRAIIQHPQAANLGLAVGIGNLGAAYGLRGQLTRAETLLREGLSLLKPGSREAALTLASLGSLYTTMADYPQAESCLKRALAIAEKLPDDFLVTNHSLLFLAEMYRQQGRFYLATAQADRLLALYEKKYGPNSLEIAKQLYFLGTIYMASNDFSRAEIIFRRRLEIVEKELGTDDPEVADALNSLCLLYGLKGDFAGLKPWRERAVSILEKRQRTNPLRTSQAIDLAGLYSYGYKGEELSKGIKLLLDSLAKDEREGGFFQMKLGKQYLLALWFGMLGDFSRAEHYYGEALKTAQTGGRVTPYVIQTLKLMADFFSNKADYVEAERIYGEALNLQRQIFGSTHPGAADLLTSLGDLYKAKGDYAGPESKYREAREIRTSVFGAASNQVIESEIKLADLYRDKGEYDRAERLYKDTLVTAENLGGPNSLPVFNLYFGLGLLYRAKEEFEQAELYLQKAQPIVEKIYGPTTLFSWGTLVIPARIHLQQGEYVKAQELFNQALAMRRKIGAPEDVSESFLRISLAETYRSQGDYARASSFNDEALTLRERLLGREHPDTIVALEALADTRQAQGDVQEAVRQRTSAAERAESNITNFLTSGSERQKSQYLVTFNKSTDAIVSLHLQSAPDNAGAKRLALTTILRRKGRALDVFSGQIASLRQRATADDQVLFDKLSAANARWTNLVFRSAALAETPSQSGTPRSFEHEISRLKEEIEQLEATLSARSAEFRAQTQSVTIEAVRAALPAETALVEFIAYRPYRPTAIGHKNKFGPTRYAAYVLTPQGEEPGFVELGEAQSLDIQAIEWRSLLGKRADEKQIRQIGTSLYRRLFSPLARLLGNHTRVFLVPDGNLNLVQFGALVDDDGRYLIEKYDLSYLTSGRELLRLQEPFSSESVPTLFANPAFDLTQAEVKCPRGIVIYNQFAFTQRCYNTLRGTAEEAVELSQLLPGAQTWTSSQATEANLKAVRRPRLLHIATHGFFLADQTAAKSGMSFGLADTGKRDTQEVNPMARSGLIMAGIKQGVGPTGEDGVLTAQEVAGLNLLGTKLVVLSACETGLGGIQNGQGVYGLRRALVLAGSETQIMSLWKVSDSATRALMVAYYKRLLAGEGRVAALRAVQLAMLRGSRSPVVTNGANRGTSDTEDTLTAQNYSHPYYWAAFIPSGDWRGLDQ